MSSSTHPRDPHAQRAALVAVGDLACDPTSEDRPGFCESSAVAVTVGELLDAGAAWFVPLGDLQYEVGGVDAFDQVYGPQFGSFTDVTEPVAGNHEWRTEDAAGYFAFFGDRAGTAQEPWRALKPATGWLLLLLDSNCEHVGGCGPDSPQGRWVKSTLRANTTECVVAAWHHPLRSSGEYADDGATRSRAQQLWSLADAGGVDVVLNGHDHIYERFDSLDGIQQFTVGTGGKSHYDVTTTTEGSLRVIGDSYGALLLTMRSDARYAYSFVGTDGQVLDHGTGACLNTPTT